MRLPVLAVLQSFLIAKLIFELIVFARGDFNELLSYLIGFSFEFDLTSFEIFDSASVVDAFDLLDTHVYEDYCDVGNTERYHYPAKV